jgi:hypothetical protein
MKDVIFWPYLGLGDQIACCGIVHYLRKTNGGKVYLPTKVKNVRNIEFLYKDFNDIKIIPVENPPKEVPRLVESMGLELVRTTIPWGRHQTDKNWDLAFYEQLGLDYSIKHEYAVLPEVDELKVMKYIPSHEYAFVYDDEERGFTYEPKTDLPIVKNIPELNMFEMVPIIRNATEIHTMIGGLMCVMELMNVPLGHQKAFLYPIRDDLNFNNKNKFEVING